jgi:hypothetical protein
MSVASKLEAEVAAIGDLSREELVARWIKAHGHPPPTGVRDGLLIHSAVWHLQVKRLGGLKAETRRRLKDAVSTVESRMARVAGGGSEAKANTGEEDTAGLSQTTPTKLSSSTKPRPVLHPGARLFREWNGQTHVVDVIEGGFVYEARIYRSITAIARQITGTHWSGPRFFGL